MAPRQFRHTIPTISQHVTYNIQALGSLDWPFGGLRLASKRLRPGADHARVKTNQLDRFRPRLCENSARDSVGARRARIFAIFLALRGDRSRNLEAAQVPSEFSHNPRP